MLYCDWPRYLFAPPLRDVVTTQPDRGRATCTCPKMASFEYEAPFTPARPRKKRKNRMPQECPDQAVVLARTVEELVSGGWISQCTRKPRCLLPHTFVQFH